MRVLSDVTTAAFQLRLEQLALLLEEQLLEERARASAIAFAAAAQLACGRDGQRVDQGVAADADNHAAQPPRGGGAAGDFAADLADYDGEAALARLNGHVARALKYLRERESSTGSTVVDASVG